MKTYVLEPTKAHSDLGRWEWYAEYSPFFSVNAQGPSGAGAEEQAYSKYQSGAVKLGPGGEKARCGWFINNDVNDGTGTMSAEFADYGYVCSKARPSVASLTATFTQPLITSVSNGVSTTKTPMSTAAKVAIGAVAVGALLLLTRKK